MTWTYDYSDRPRPSYRIQDGSDDGDVAECWDEDVAKAIVAAMNSVEHSTTAIVAPEPAKAAERRWGVWRTHGKTDVWTALDGEWDEIAAKAKAAGWNDGRYGSHYRYEARPLPETEEK